MKTDQLDLEREDANSALLALLKLRERVHGPIYAARERLAAARRDLLALERALVTADEAHARCDAWAAFINADDAIKRAANVFLNQPGGRPFVLGPSDEIPDSRLAVRQSHEALLALFLPLVADQVAKRIHAAIDSFDAPLRVASADHAARIEEQKQAILKIEIEEATLHAIAEGAGVPLDLRPDISPAAVHAAHGDAFIAHALAWADECASAHAGVLRLGDERSDRRDTRNAARNVVEIGKKKAGTMSEAAAEDLRRAHDAFADAETRYENLERRAVNLRKLVQALKEYAADHHLSGWQVLRDARMSGTRLGSMRAGADVHQPRSDGIGGHS